METDFNSMIIDRRRQHRLNWLILAIAGLGVLGVGALAGSAITARGWSPFASGDGKKVPIYLAANQERVSQPLNLATGFSAVAKAVTPAVVTVRTKSRVHASPMMIDPFRDFFDGQGQDDDRSQRRGTPRSPQPQDKNAPLRPSGVGSGVLVSPDGYILTNNHVVDGADKVDVVLTDRRIFPARVVGTDAPTDIAVLKIEGSSLPTLPLGDSNQVEVGDVVLAIGNPLDIGQTVTMGIISAKGRTTGGAQSYEDFLQTDAAINRGNSGGALVNLRGELIGIPSQIVAGWGVGGNIGIGFAIPTVMARNVMDQLIRSGKVRRGMLGVQIRELSPDLAEQFGYKGTGGALVEKVEPGKPAELAGVKRGDIVTEFQGQKISDQSQLRNLASQTSPGTSVKFKIWRDGSERELTAKLAEMSTELAAANSERGGVEPDAGSVMSGVRGESLTPELGRRLDLPGSVRGVVVNDIDESSNGYQAGLRRGDVIEEVAKQPVTNVADYNAALKRTGNKSVLLSVRRQKTSQYIVVRPQE